MKYLIICLLPFFLFGCLDIFEEKTWKQLESKDKALAQPTEPSKIDYSLSGSHIYPTHSVRFTISFTGKLPERRPIATKAVMHDASDPKVAIVSDDPHRGGSETHVYMGAWTSGFDAEGNLVITFSANPGHFRKVYNVPSGNDVILNVELEAEGFRPLSLSHVFDDESIY